MICQAAIPIAIFKFRQIISIERLVEGPPRIISMTIVGVTPVGGYYNLDILQSYTARIIVDSGTISYLIRVEGSNLSPNILLSPSSIVDNISANSGTKKYDFIITPTVDGIFQLAFQIRDRGTWNVYDINGGIAVQVRWAPPQIVSTTIEAAEIVDDRYQLNAGKSYTATVIVSSGNVTYDTRIEGTNNSEMLNQSPSFQDKTIPRVSGNHVFQFTFQPKALGIFQIAFQLRDIGTSNIFNADGGVAVLVLPSTASPPPRIISTTILDAHIDSGRYQLIVGKRYFVKVIVAAGVVANTFSVEQNENIPPPTWANVHNDAGSLWRLDPEKDPKDFTFTIAPTSTGTGQVSFMLRDAPPWINSDGWLQPGTGNSYGHDGGVAFEALAEKPGVYGTVTTTSGTPIPAAKVTIYPSGDFILTHSNGTYQFPTLINGTYRIVISKSGYSTSEIVNLNFSGSGFSADAKLEQEFASLIEAHIIYKRYIDYSHGLTFIHMLELPRATTHTALLTSRFMLPEDGDELIRFQTPSEIAKEFGPRALINGGFFDYGTGHAVGYYYSDGYHPSNVMNHNTGENPLWPVFGIYGISTDQTIRIVSKQGIFSDPAATDWNATGSVPLWDDPPRDEVSDVAYAIQMDAYLNKGDTVGVFGGDYAKYWARTSIGIKSTGSLLLVVADGEGIDGAQGASFGQLGEFFRDVLGASVSMALDGGGSSVMAVKSGTNYKQLTKSTAENPRWHIDANADSGRGVLNYLMVR